MTLTTDRDHPGINKPKDGDSSRQNEAYIILSEEERAKGFVRPVRLKYQHVGIKPRYPLRDLTEEESEIHGGYGYVQYEADLDDESAMCGRFWTQKMLDSGCDSVTSMHKDLAETYARDPKFYGSTWCVSCRGHYRVDEFVWDGTVEVVGS